MVIIWMLSSVVFALAAANSIDKIQFGKALFYSLISILDTALAAASLVIHYLQLKEKSCQSDPTKPKPKQPSDQI